MIISSEDIIKMKILRMQKSLPRILGSINILKLIAILSGLMGFGITQGCTNGCLRCTTNGICLLCDAQLFYVRNGYECVKNTIDNCFGTIDGKTCAVCISNYYFNTTLNRCEKVLNPRTNCMSYDTTAHCSQCNSSSFYIDGTGNCVALTSNVANCAVHMVNGLCLNCKYGFIKSTDNSTCTAVVNSPNCLLYSGDFQCTKCNEGYLLMQNKYILDLKQNYLFLVSFYQEIISQSLFSTTIAKSSTNVCAKQINNCQEISPYNNCTTCTSNYFNENGVCLPNPSQIISNCQIYTSTSVCSTCAQGYYLKSNECMPVKLIPNCLKYDNTQSSVCLACTASYYSQGSLCALRTNLISNCIKFDLVNDKCESCSTSYLVTPNGLQCLENIKYCYVPTYLSSTNGGFIASCVQCIDQFYVSTVIKNGIIFTSCLIPTQLIEGCLVYQQANLCIKCENGYYLANFNCIKHDRNILNMIVCGVYSTEQKNLCASCSPEQYLYRLINYCNPVPSVLPNCHTYNSNGVCSQCVNPYYLVSDIQNNLSCELTEIQNCIKTAVNSNICLQCDPQTGTMPNNALPNNMCTIIPIIFSANCQEFSVDIVSGITNCVSCFAPRYPLTMNSIYYQFCYSFNEIQNIGSGITNTIINNLGTCLAFDLTSQFCLFCDPESITKVIASKSPGNCVSECVWGDEVILTFDFNGIFPSAFFRCNQVSLIHMDGDSSTNCQRADYDVSVPVYKLGESDIKQYCADCLVNHIGIVYSYTSNFYSHYDYLPLAKFNNQISSSSFFSHLIKVPIYQNCKPWNTNFMINNAIPFTTSGQKDWNQNLLAVYSFNSIYFVLNWQNFVKCKSLIGELQSNGYYAYACASCLFSYTGAVIRSDAGTNFIYNCQSMADCNTNFYFSGIGSHDINAQMYLYVSCHVCIDKTKIVTITSAQPWTIPNDQTRPLNYDFARTGYYPLNSCYPPGIVASNQNVFPRNCLIQQVLPNQVFQAYTPTLSIAPNPACVACEPMYYPILSGNALQFQTYQYIVSCIQIANCQSSNSFNSCEICMPSYVLAASSTAVGNTTAFACVPNNVPGCSIGYKNDVCIICLPKYVLNVYGLCDLVEMARCNIWGNLTPYSTAYQYLTLVPYPQGCIQCAPGSYSVRFPRPVTICVLSQSTSATTITPNFFIANCLYYGLNSANQLICVTCATGYSPTNTKNNCFKFNLIQNCLIYTSNSNQISQFCYQCIDQYYLETNILCSPGVIKNCLVYINFRNCQTCVPGMVATKINFSKYIVCFDVSNSLKNCQSFDLSSALSGYLLCTQCAAGNYLVTPGVPISTCSVFSKIPNCITYDLDTSFQKTSFFCVLCSPAYYVLANVYPSICFKRNNYPIANCLVHNPFRDLCSSCITGFFLSSDALSCVQNPNGIMGCRLYKNVTYCSECDGNNQFYISNGVCLVLQQSLVVPNCYTYNSQSICMICRPGYSYSNGICNLVTIQNCLTIGAGNVCLRCTSTYTLIAGACAITTLTNCLVFSTASSCGVCQPGYYLNTGRCLIPASINDCVSYSSGIQCSLCRSGMVLETNKGWCSGLNSTQLAYSNPTCNQYARPSICIYCALGFFFDPVTGNCKACSVSPSDSCAICDFLNPSNCLICMSGYYMTQTLVCAKNKDITVSVVAVDDSNLDFYKISELLAISWLSIMMTVHLVLS